VFQNNNLDKNVRQSWIRTYDKSASEHTTSWILSFGLLDFVKTAAFSVHSGIVQVASESVPTSVTVLKSPAVASTPTSVVEAVFVFAI